MKGCSKYRGSVTIVVTISHLSPFGSVKDSKYSSSTAFALYGTPFFRKYPGRMWFVSTFKNPSLPCLLGLVLGPLADFLVFALPRKQRNNLATSQVRRSGPSRSHFPPAMALQNARDEFGFRRQYRCAECCR